MPPSPYCHPISHLPDFYLLSVFLPCSLPSLSPYPFFSVPFPCYVISVHSSDFLICYARADFSVEGEVPGGSRQQAGHPGHRGKHPFIRELSLPFLLLVPPSTFPLSLFPPSHLTHLSSSFSSGSSQTLLSLLAHPSPFLVQAALANLANMSANRYVASLS